MLVFVVDVKRTMIAAIAAAVIIASCTTSDPMPTSDPYPTPVPTRIREARRIDRAIRADCSEYLKAEADADWGHYSVFRDALESRY